MKFFDKMKDSISLAGTGVSQKVSCTADTMKLNSQIRNNDKKIEKLVYQVGLKCVQLHLDNPSSEYEELFGQIRHLQELNKTHQEEIKRLSEEWELQEQLRQQEIKDRQAESEQPDKTTKLCKNCNKRSELDAKFCVHCGTPFSIDITEPEFPTENNIF